MLNYDKLFDDDDIKNETSINKKITKNVDF